jgi:hypothetical protein
MSSGILFVVIEGGRPGSEDFKGRAYKSGHAHAQFKFKAIERTIYIAVLTFTGQSSYRPNAIFGLASRALPPIPIIQNARIVE